MEVKKRENLLKKLVAVKPKIKPLFYLGEWREDLFEKCVAVVGSRRMTSYGERVIEKIVPVLVDAGVTIVSGFMYGVDQKAHEICVECGGKTIAVLGWGIKYKESGYRNKATGIGYQKIIDSGGLILSEWGEEEAPQLWMFPYRNRIVAGLSEAVLVIEAAEKSGSLITARMAVEQGKILLAVPGPITSKVSEGTAGLIKTGVARMVSSGEEILEVCGWATTNKSNRTNKTHRVMATSGSVLEVLGDEALMVDEIARKLKKPIEEIIRELCKLELEGKIKESEGRYYLK